MRVIIMCAGMGTRISRFINNIPKCTVDIGNTTLIENTIRKLKKKGIYEIALVVGYEKDRIKNILHNENVKFYDNPFFKITNSIVSLWLARDFVKNDKDLILINGDVYFDEKILDQIIEETTTPVLFSDETRILEADYKLKYINNKLIDNGKELSNNEATGEYIGIAKLSKNNIPIFMENLDKLIYNQNFNMWWEDVLYTIKDKISIYVKDIKKLFWAEVDIYNDYLRILDYVKINNSDNIIEV